ncbi:HAD family phosphatase [Paenibacillus sp. MWE-103]|uniref:HAD family phosphatase n=1 Tax=Paenibacillus artemisiicola TaxID=1172618 RepID=A0ABS3WDF9_9BACL|nr:HAD family hydrolase [Paenibacillus artemisiicola]MBO7746342.1 HAD family phosphatase [Paenibacillus artemisiicola]
MQPQLIFFDFDDTLYSHKTQRVSSSTRDALIELQARGHTIVIATGRGPASMAFIQEQLAVPCDTVVFLNGQLIFRRRQKIFERFITLPSMDRMIEIARSCGIAYGGHYAYGEIVDHVNERVEKVWHDFGSKLPHVRNRFERSHPLYQAHLYITREEARHVQDFLDDYVIHWSHDYLVNLISKEAGKSQAVRWLLQESGIPTDRSFAFGDGFNDVDMLLAVGHGVAMGNASDALKEVAELITGSADEDGIRQALTSYGLL